MTRRTFIITIAVLTALTPFLGFPLPFEHTFSVIAGALIAFLVYISRGKECVGCGSPENNVKKNKEDFTETSNVKAGNMNISESNPLAQ